MGNFNISGFYSHLPIKFGDKIGAILCACQPGCSNLVMNTNGLGLVPLMAPVYGRYDDCGGIDNIVESLSTKVFKDLTGFDFQTLADKSYRNSNVTVKTPDNGNQFDDIPGYQAIIKHFIRHHHWAMPKEALIKNIEEARMKDETHVAEQYQSLLDYELGQEAALSDATFMLIYEHESVLRQLVRIGEVHMNREWFDTVYDASEDYDKLAVYADKFGGSIFNIYEMEQHIMKGLKGTLENIKMTNDAEVIEKLKAETAATFNEDYFKMESDARKAELQLFTDWMRFSDFFCAVYKNQSLSYAELKDDILELLYLDSGLYNMHGVYCPSSYAGQDIDAWEVSCMQTVFSEIRDSLVKLSE